MLAWIQNKVFILDLYFYNTNPRGINSSFGLNIKKLEETREKKFLPASAWEKYKNERNIKNVTK